MKAFLKTLLVALALGTAVPAYAMERAFALDAQRFTVDGGRSVQSATAALVLAGRGGDGSLAVTRVDDSFDGAGWAVTLGGAASLTPVVSLRGALTRVDRSAALDAFGARLGPEVRAGGATLGLAATWSRRADGVVTRGAALDLEHAVAPRLAARVSGSFARTSGEPDASAAAVGARWNAAGPLHLLGEVGLARDPAGALNGGGVLGGLSPEPSGDDAARLTGRLGARLIFF
jgi:hypothetical protein